MAFASVLGFLSKLEGSIGLDAFPKYRQEGAEKSDAPFLLFFVGFTLFVYLLETYLDLRQHRNLKTATPPSTLLEVLKTVDEDNKGLEAVSKVWDFCSAGSYCRAVLQVRRLDSTSTVPSFLTQVYVLSKPRTYVASEPAT